MARNDVKIGIHADKKNVPVFHNSIVRFGFSKSSEKKINFSLMFKNRDYQQILKELEALEQQQGISFEILPYERLLSLCLENEDATMGKYIFDKLLKQRKDVGESVYSTMVSLLCVRSIPEAVQLFEEMKARGVAPRLRTYTPLVVALSEQGEVEKALKLVDEGIAAGILPSEQGLTAIVKAATSAAATALDGFSDSSNNSKDDSDGSCWQVGMEAIRRMRSSRLLLSVDAMVGLESFFAADPRGRKWIPKWSKVEPSGLCSTCNRHLNPMVLQPEKHAMLLAHLQKSVTESTAKEMRAFQRFMMNFAKIDAVLDGMNIGYHRGRVSAEGNIRFNCSQVHAVAHYFQSRGMTVVILVRAHALRMDPELATLRRNKLVFAVDTADDSFFMIAAVAAGMDVQMVTNDELGDHIHMMPPDLMHHFVQWKAAHQVHFQFDREEQLWLEPRIVHDQYVQWNDNETAFHFPPVTSSSSWLCMSQAQ